MEVGKNIIASLVDGTKVRMDIDTTKTLGPSASGKTEMIAQLSGVMGGTKAKISGNIYVKVGEKVNGVDQPVAEDIGKNFSWTMSGTMLSIVMDLSGAAEEKTVSSSGKTILLASTQGNKAIGKTKITAGINCYVAVGTDFEMPALTKWLRADGGTAAGPWDVAQEGDNLVLSGILPKDGKLTTGQFVPCGSGMNVSLTVESKSLEATNGWADLVKEGATNLEVCTKPDENYVAIRFNKTADNGISGSGKSIQVASSKKVKNAFGFKLNFNAIRPRQAPSAETVKAAIIAELEKRGFDLSTVTKKILRAAVCEAINWPEENDAALNFSDRFTEVMAQDDVRAKAEKAKKEGGSAVKREREESSGVVKKEEDEDDLKKHHARSEE